MSGPTTEYVDSDPCAEPTLMFDQFMKTVVDMGPEAYDMYLTLRELRCGPTETKVLVNIPDHEKLKFVFSGHHVPLPTSNLPQIPTPETGILLGTALLATVILKRISK